MQVSLMHSTNSVTRPCDKCSTKNNNINLAWPQDPATGLALNKHPNINPYLREAVRVNCGRPHEPSKRASYGSASAVLEQPRGGLRL
jgi:hypothetical protein